MQKSRQPKTDVLTNIYESLPEHLQPKFKVDKQFASHLIPPHSMIALVGSTGCGKTQALLHFLQRKHSSFVEIIVFTGSVADEPLYAHLKQQIPEIELIDDVANLPCLDERKGGVEDKNEERLIVFDDVNLLPKKAQTEICNWFKCCRKLGFTAVILAQKYSAIPLFIREQISIYQLFKSGDVRSVKTILNNHNILGLDKATLFRLYSTATREPFSFLTIDLGKNTPDNRRYRQNFIGDL